MGTRGRESLVLDLFERFYERVYGFARRSVDAATAEDIAQEVFVRLLDQEGLEHRTISVSYLIKIADNLIKRRYRRQRRAERATAELERRREAPAQAGPAEVRRVETPDQDEAEARFRFDVLSSREEDAVRLIVCRGLSYREAARALDVNVTAVNNWKYRGVQRLRQLNEPDPDRRGDRRGDPVERSGVG